jgi:dCTP deaminase
MSVYSNSQIKQAINGGSIVCVPFMPEHLNGASLSVTLGYYYYRISGHSGIPIYNPLHTEDGVRHFDGPHKAITHQEWCDKHGVKPVANIPLEHPVISLNPKERIVAHTHEFIGILSPGTAEVRSLVNWRLNGVVISLRPALIETNKINRHTLEIYNSNEQEVILLPVGERIAQVIFWHHAQEESVGKSATRSAWENSLERALTEWSPSRLLDPAPANAGKLDHK